MEKNDQTVEITITCEEKAMIDVLSCQCQMTSAQLVRTILFESGILTPLAGGKNQANSSDCPGPGGEGQQEARGLPCPCRRVTHGRQDWPVVAATAAPHPMTTTASC